MGFDLQVLRFILASKRANVDFSRTATLGRQNLAVHPDVFKREALRFGFPELERDTREIYASFPYADGFLRHLGADSLSAIDASDYEGADIILDMNRPLSPDFPGGFSVIIDGGSMEHIFDVPQCLKNIVSMLDNDGAIISINGANNFMGHGFYQFSPEFFFRVFCKDNGFVTDEVVLSEVHTDAVWHEAKDPAVLRRRLELVNSNPTYIMVRARKLRSAEFPETIPQQSDYQRGMWIEGSQHMRSDTVDHLAPTLGHKILRRILPPHLRRLCRSVLSAVRDPYKESRMEQRPFPKRASGRHLT
jgi:hypothetical protein